MNVLVIGGGAAGYFAAIAAAENHPQARVEICEGAKPLAKVRISGGGRCNVTTSLSDPSTVIDHYPRGRKELRGPFRRFGPRETVEWFAERGVALKTEADGRMFPTTDDSGTVISCLQQAAERAGVRLQRGAGVRAIDRDADGFACATADGVRHADRVVLATGGGKAGHRLASSLGHRIVDPVPSIFTYTVADAQLRALSGLSVPDARLVLKCDEERFEQRGPVLITHWGLSGPAVLRQSAFAARALAASDYRGELQIDWTGSGEEALRAWLGGQRGARGKATVQAHAHPALPQRLWQFLIERAQVPADRRWSGLTKDEMTRLVRELSACPLALAGKGVFKEEFVTAGGVARAEIDWRTMASKVCQGLHLCGEVIDIDGVTGGFNFQAAWTTGHLAGLGVGA